MKRLLTAVVLIPIVLALTFKAPLWLFCMVVSIVAILAMREYMDLVVGYGYEPMRMTTYIITPFYFAYLAVVAKGVGDEMSARWFILLTAAATLPVAFLYALLGLRKQLKLALPSVAMTWAGFIYICFALATIILIRILPMGPFYLLYLFVIVWAGDAFAYWVGKSIGRHKLAPTISPQKTWEGALASITSAAILGLIMLRFQPEILDSLGRWHLGLRMTWPGAHIYDDTIARSSDFPVVSVSTALLCSALINVAAQFGDLVESMMKRGAGVKDSGAILPGHGGMLDRVDALLFAAPFGFLVILFAIHS